MSRIGNKPIDVPNGVEIKLDGQEISVKGPKGNLSMEIHKNMKVNVDGSIITVVRPDDEPANRSLHGLTRTLINNMIIGVTEEFKRELEVNGVGYKATKQGKKLIMSLGYSHLVEIDEPAGITIDVPNPNQIVVRGSNKEAVGQLAAVIRSKRPPEVYRGKGIKYAEETIRRKEGKSGKK